MPTAFRWADLGLTTVWIDGPGGGILYDLEEDAPAPGGRPVPSGILRISYPAVDDIEPVDGVLDVRALARCLLPTLAEHRMDIVCDRYGLGIGEPEAEALVHVLRALLEEAVGLDRQVIALLAELSPPPMSDILARVLVMPVMTPPAEPSDAHAGDEVSQPTPIVASSAEALGPAGPIAESLGTFEKRDGQLAMAAAVETAFSDGLAALVEAGPGTGKTFAYVVPAVLHLLQNPEDRVVVSTRTRQLQEQLYGKDLPFLIDKIAPSLEMALLKGRENYLCLRKWHALIGELSESLERDLVLPRLAPLVRWIAETETGDIEENSAFLSDPQSRSLWYRLGDSPHHCTGTLCPFGEECFSVQARRRARRADLVVVNHSLLLSDLVVGGVILGKYTHLVVDEAHTLEATARMAFTRQLTERSFLMLVDDLAPTGRRRRRGWLQRTPFAGGRDAVARVEDLLVRVRKQASSAFRQLERSLPDGERRAAFTSLTEICDEMGEAPLLLTQLEDALDSLSDYVEDDEPRKELEGYVRLVQELRSVVSTLSLPPSENVVHWYERHPHALTFHATPLEIAPFLAELLYPKLKALVMTSATLSLGGTFDYLQRSVGLSNEALPIRTLIAASPFAYDDRMRILVPKYLPPVNGELDPYAESIADLISVLSGTLARNGLALFTSYAMMQAVKGHLPPTIRTFVQGELSRTSLIAGFRNAVAPTWLLGTESFWEGVDFPRDELEILLIARLPFPVPTDPVLAAMGKRVTQTGHDAFVDLSIPMAGLKLRQGIGRLIRTTGDRGLVFLTDERIVTRSYGRMFAQSLPVNLEVVNDPESLLRKARSWFGEDAESSTG